MFVLQVLVIILLQLILIFMNGLRNEGSETICNLLLCPRKSKDSNASSGSEGQGLKTVWLSYLPSYPCYFFFFHFEFNVILTICMLGTLVYLNLHKY
jgi:hypothetical protein